MIFNKIFVENEVIENAITKSFIAKYPRAKIEYIDDAMNVWGRVKKPYLQKRNNLNLFIAKKRGQLVKETPPAYGLSGGKHYYFIHAYNCIFECQYCYLQGYFHTPDLVVFVNHDEICDEIAKIIESNPYERCWFHAGEYSDSLALSSVTLEWSYYWELFKKFPEARLELRTKSSHVREIENLKPLNNIITSFSLSSEKASTNIDLKTPSMSARLRSIKKLASKGFRLGIHFDPMVYTPTYEEDYREACLALREAVSPECIEYISVGVVRFTKDVHREFTRNYPQSPINSTEMVTSEQGLIRYHKPVRMQMMSFLKKELVGLGYSESSVYLCMEDEGITSQN